MYLFLLVAFPAFCLGWFLSLPKYDRTSFIAPLIGGMLTGVVVCTIKAFFIFSNHVWSASFMGTFVYLFFVETLLPCVLLYTVFNLFSKDDGSYRADSFLPLLSAFYSIFLPFRVITLGEPLTVFPLFVKPILYISAIALMATFIHRVFDLLSTKPISKIILNCALGLLTAAFPTLLEAWWHKGGKMILWLPLAVIYSASSFVFYLKLKKDTIHEPLFMSM